jgi:hypothetical protein
MKQRRCLLVPVLTDHNAAPCQNKIACIYVYTEDDVERIVPFYHTEQLRGFSEHIPRFLQLDDIFIHDKKIWLQMGGNNKTYDVKTLWWHTYQEAYDETHYYTAAHNYYWRRHTNLQHVNSIVPIMQHLAMCQKIRQYAWPMIQNAKLTESYLTFNSLYPKTFAQIESAGLQVNQNFANTDLIKDGRVYSQYNYHTSTGRPSNARRGFNFAAMNKEDGTRSAFCSRFKQGVLVEMDFDSYHVRLIAKLIGYKLPLTSIHDYLGQFYFDTTDLTAEQREQSKSITFRLLYGGIDREFLTIPFFRQVNEFVNDIWTQWKSKKYIHTAIDKRVISQEQFPDMNRFKLFNYYLQSLETEFSVRKLTQVLNRLQSKQSRLILYTYDSVLFDVDMAEAKQLIPELQEVLQQGNFPVKSKYGDIYSKMTEFTL